jgi:uncharacterized membrane-anchored protein YitT (DUF2179 family)
MDVSENFWVSVGVFLLFVGALILLASAFFTVTPSWIFIAYFSIAMFYTMVTIILIGRM